METLVGGMIFLIYILSILYILSTYKVINSIYNVQRTQGKVIEELLKYHIEEMQDQLEQMEEEKD